MKHKEISVNKKDISSQAIAHNYWYKYGHFSDFEDILSIRIYTQ